MTDAQGWTLLALVGVLLSVIGSLLVQQIREVGDRIDTRIDGLEGTIDARLTGFQASVDARFDAVSQRFDAVRQRFDHLDRDVQAIARVVFPRE